MKNRRKKLLILISIVICIIILFIVNIFIIHNRLPKGVIIKTYNNDVEVYTDLKIKDIITKKNIEITNIDDTINTKKIGKRDINIYFKYKLMKYVYKTSIDVVDTEKPMLVTSKRKTTLVGKDYDFCKHAFYGDNYDRKPKCDVTGKYDINSEGTYNINVEVTDQSNNKSVQNVTYNVIKEYPKSTNTSKPEEPVIIEFADVIANYKTSNNEIGIDVSKWQKEIDFKKVKDAGCEFVMLRLGIQSGKNKEITVDENFEKYYKDAKSNNLKVGVYVFSTAIKKSTAIKHAKWTLKELKNKEIDLPIAFDWEYFSYWNEYGMNFYDINEIADSFIYTIEDNGYKGALYGSKYYLENIWNTRVNHDVWLAHYTDKTSYKDNYFMWQLTEKGYIDGISTDVDIDILYK